MLAICKDTNPSSSSGKSQFELELYSTWQPEPHSQPAAGSQTSASLAVWL